MIRITRPSGVYTIQISKDLDDVQILRVLDSTNKTIGYIIHTRINVPSKRQVLDYLNYLFVKRLDGVAFVRSISKNFVLIDVVLKGVSEDTVLLFSDTLRGILKSWGISITKEDITNTIQKYPMYVDYLIHVLETIPAFATLSPEIQTPTVQEEVEDITIVSSYPVSIKTVQTTTTLRKQSYTTTSPKEEQTEDTYEEEEEEHEEYETEEEPTTTQVQETTSTDTVRSFTPPVRPVSVPSSTESTTSTDTIKKQLEEVLGKDVVIGYKIDRAGVLRGVVSVPLQDLTSHLLLAAPTGWGKTAMLKTILFSAALAGADVLIIDPKDYDIANGIVPGKVVEKVRSKHRGILYGYLKDILPEDLVKEFEEKGLIEFEWKGKKIRTEVYHIVLNRDDPNIIGYPIVPSVLGLAYIIYTVKKNEGMSPVDAAYSAAHCIMPLLFKGLEEGRGTTRQSLYNYCVEALARLIQDYVEGNQNIKNDEEFASLFEGYLKMVMEEILNESKEVINLFRNYKRSYHISLHNVVRSSLNIVPHPQDIEYLKKFMSFGDENTSYIKIIEPSISFASISSEDPVSLVQAMTLLLLPKLLISSKKMSGRNKILLEVLDEYLNLLRILPESTRKRIITDLETSLKIMRGLGVGILLVVQRIRKEEIGVEDASMYSLISQFNIKILAKIKEMISAPPRVLGNVVYSIDEGITSKKTQWVILKPDGKIEYVKTMLPPLIPHASQTIVANDIKKVLRAYYVENKQVKELPNIIQTT